MAVQTGSKKRKSFDGQDVSVKKAKVASSAERVVPAKSALKKSKPLENVENEKPSKSVPGHKTGSSKAQSSATGKTTVVHKERISDSTSSNANKSLSRAETEALLAGFSSSDEEEDDEAEVGLALSKLPQAPTTGEVQKRIKEAIAEQNDPDNEPGVIYIGRIPHGFYEKQMRAYLDQFGEISKLRLARNKKTGRSKHYAFVEFASAAVADIVVKTMDKYLLFGHLLQVRRVPKEQVSENMFVGAKKHAVPRNRMERRFLNNGMVRDDWQRRITRERKRREEKEKQLKEYGYDFEMPALRDVDEVVAKPKELAQVAN